MKKVVFALIGFIVVGGLAFSLNEVGAKSFEKENSFKASSIEELEIHNGSWDIEFKNNESNKIKIVVEGKQKNKKKDPVIIENDGKKVVVNQQEEGGSFIDGFTFGKKGTIYISIPKSGVDTITLNNSSGDMKMDDITTENIVISNNFGAGKIEGLSANKGKFTSKDGELSLKDSSFKELIVASTIGDNYITNVSSPKMKIISTDGEVVIKDIREEKSLFVETKSGDIAVSYKKIPTSLAFTANSGSSDITVDLDGLKNKTNTEKSKEGKIGNGSNELKILSEKGTININ